MHCVIYLKNNLKQRRSRKLISQSCQHRHLCVFFLHKKARSYKFEDTVHQSTVKAETQVDSIASLASLEFVLVSSQMLSYVS